MLRKARDAVAALDRKAADVTSAAAVEGDTSSRLAGTIAALKSKVADVKLCLEVRCPVPICRKFLATQA